MHFFRTVAVSLGCVATIFSFSSAPTFIESQVTTVAPFFKHMFLSSDNSSTNSTMSADSTSGTQYDAWIYPDAPNALRELQQIGHVHAVKAEFLHVSDDGTLQQINQDSDNPNGYSPSVVQIMNDHSDQQYITVSGTMAGTTLAMQNPDTIPTMVNLANKIGFGIDLDWEEFGQWTPDYYQQYKTFVQNLSAALHANKHYLSIDGPPIYDATSQSWYQWKYEDLAPYVNSIVMMIYDNEYDTGVGGSIAPVDWSASCLQWLKDKAGGKGVPGLAAYGYKGTFSTGRITVNTSGAISDLLDTVGSLLATRDPNGDLTSSLGNTFYDYSDQKTVDMRVRQAQNMGFTHVSIWSLGDNPWPSVK